MAQKLMFQEMTRDELDMSIMSKIATGVHCSETTRPTKVKGHSVREHQKTDYFHHGYKICREMFKKIHRIGQHRLNSLMS